MSIDYIKTSFGFHRLQDVQPEVKGKVVAFNIANGAGYIPGVGTIVGIARIIFFWRLLENHPTEMTALDKKVCRLQILRGIVESVGLGICYLSMDVLVTLERREGKMLPPEQPQEVETLAKDEIQDAAPVVAYGEPLCPDLVEAWEKRFSDR